MGFGQHQTFYLRLNWLRKGINEIKKNNRFFYEDDAAETIGLGKNMVQSLRFWMLATGIIEKKGQAEHTLSEIGRLIETHDPYLDLPDSLALLHYSLVKSDDPSTSWYWFFNVNEKKVGEKELILKELENWTIDKYKKEFSVNTLRKDLDCIIRLYFEKDISQDPEDVMQSPLSKLQLLREVKVKGKEEIITKQSTTFEKIGPMALYYTLLKYREDHSQGDNWITSLTVEEIETRENLWGKVFHLPRVEIIRAIECLSERATYPIRFERTNQLNSIRLPEIQSENFLQQEYKHYKERQFS